MSTLGNQLPAVPSIAGLRSQADKAVGFRDALHRQSESNKAEIRRLTDEEALLTLVGSLLRALADAEVSEGVEAVTKLQTEALQEIFDDLDLSLEAEITESRGKISVSLLTVSNRTGEPFRQEALDAFGGSVATVQSVLLRIITMMRRGLRPVLLMDETLHAIQRVYIDRFAKFLTELSDRFPGGLDILAITHDPLLIDAAPRAYTLVETANGVTFKARRNGTKDPS